MGLLELHWHRYFYPFVSHFSAAINAVAYAIYCEVHSEMVSKNSLANFPSKILEQSCQNTQT